MIRRIVTLFFISLIAGSSLNWADSPQNDAASQAPKDLVYVGIPNQNVPVVSFMVVIKSGSAADPSGKEGLAHFTANLLQRGTARFSRDSIENMLDDIGGRFSVRVDRDVIVISGQTLLENLDRYYEIFSDILLYPVFPDDEARKLKIDQGQALQRIVRNDAELSLAVLQAYLYQGHPYAHPVEGYLSSIEKLTTADARTFYNMHFKRGNIICGLAGSYPKEFADRFKNDLEKLPKGTVDRDHLQPTPALKRSVVLVEKEGRDQAQIRMGKLVDYTRRDSVWYDLLVANTYLGQHRQSFGRLYTTIRTERGMSYGAYSYLEHFQQAGWSSNALPLVPFDPQYFSIWTYPKRVNAKFAIKMALYELDKLNSNPLDSVSLDRARNFQINQFPFLIETPASLLAVTLEANYFGLPDFLTQFGDRVARVSSVNVLKAVSRNWSPENLLIVIVTDSAEALKNELLSAQTALELPSGATSQGLEKVNEQVKNIDLKLKPEDIVILNAEKLFN